MKNWKLWIAAAVLAIAVVAVVAWALERARAAEAKAESLEILRTLEAKNFVAEYAIQRKALQAEVDAALAASGPLAAEVDRLESLLRVRPVRIVKGSTGPVPVAVPLGPPAEPPSVGPGPCPPAPRCLLAPGDTGEARFVEITFETKATVRAVVAEVECRRLQPLPEERLFGGLIRREFTEALVAPGEPGAARLPGWGFGAAGAAGRFGWTAGPAVAFPPLRVWRFQGEATAGITLGPSGEFAAVATAIVR